MTELTADKIRAAGSVKMIMVWRKIYNHLCRSCQVKVFRAATDVKQVGTQVVHNRMKEIIDNHLCVKCKLTINRLLDEAKRK